MLARSSRIGDPPGMAAGGSVLTQRWDLASASLVAGRLLPVSNNTQPYPDRHSDSHVQTDDRITFGQGAA
jgi:hypothetical protein